jgi:hypothetical protein
MTDKMIYEGTLQAHETDSVFYISQNGWHLAKARIETTRQRREDWSGQKAFRMIVNSQASVELELAYKISVTVQNFKTSNGRIATLRELMQTIEQGHMARFARQQLQDTARETGASDLDILNAWHEDEKQHARNLYNLTN